MQDYKNSVEILVTNWANHSIEIEGNTVEKDVIYSYVNADKNSSKVTEKLSCEIYCFPWYKQSSTITLVEQMPFLDDISVEFIDCYYKEDL